MITTLSDGCVLIPHLPDWGSAPTTTRKWESGVTTGITLAEDRQALRQAPIYGLTWTVTPFDGAENEIFAAAVRQALRVGNAAVPWWGRCLVVSAAGVAIGSTTVPIAGFIPVEWLPSGGDQLFACGQKWASDGGAAWELLTVASVTPGVDGAEHSIEVTVASTLPLAGGASAVWPLLRGQFSAAEISYDRPTIGPQQLTVQGPVVTGNPGPSMSSALVRWGRLGPDDSSPYSWSVGWWADPTFVMLTGLPSAETVPEFARPGGYAFSTVHGTTLQVDPYSTSISTSEVPWSTARDFPKFDPTLGRIDHISIELQNALRSFPRAENLDAYAHTLTVGSMSLASVADPGSNVLVTSGATVSTSVAVYAYDGVTDYAGSTGTASGFVIDPPLSASHTETITLTSSSPRFAQFIGSGTLSLTLSAGGTQIATGSPSISAQITTETGINIAVRYHYSKVEGYVWLAVPEWTDWAPRPGDGVALLSTGATFPMASAADLGGSTEKNGFGRLLVTDNDGESYWLYRSRDVLYSGDDDALVVRT